MKEIKHPQRIAGLSIISNTIVVTLKTIVGILSGSVAVLSEAIHSGLDLVASMIAYFSVKISSRPPDKKHPYGHGKVENISGTLETLLIFIAGIWIIYESVQKLIDPSPIKMPTLAVGVMVVGATINLIVGKIVKKVGEKHESVAMQSNALHLLTDVYSSIGIAISIVIVSLTDFYILDPLIGIGVAVFIMVEAYSLGKKSFTPLIDTRLTNEELIKIMNVLDSFKNEYIEYHDLRTRRAGAEKHIDFHLIVPGNTTVLTSHQLCNRIETGIEQVLPKSNVVIHVEPENEKKYVN
ncbi:MAG TPA: cation diffusion facilitator family transporter [Massilibacterium sp.]|nr:cation diffusion facilitator family transporter [Massilibacterium sp.]